ncbi:MAG TPA: PspA/IM30 family protein [Gemmataceae bacterium]|nr:PspA/IM30 family protein [Gemmataceae bacterium]
MTLLSRCSDILAANIHSLLDRAEDPETMIAQIIRDMEDAAAAARGHAASAIAAERWLSRELSKQQAGIDYWHSKARTAVVANRDDLARVALSRKKELESAAEELALQHAAARDTSAQARAALDTLEANLAAAQRRQRLLIARNRAAQTRRALGYAAGKRLGSRATLESKLQHWEQRLSVLEDEVAAATEVQGLEQDADATFAKWEAETDIERELNELKEGTRKE